MDKKKKSSNKSQGNASVVKHSLSNPFQLQWPIVGEEVSTVIIKLIKSSFDGVKLHKPEKQISRDERRSRKRGSRTFDIETPDAKKCLSNPHCPDIAKETIDIVASRTPKCLKVEKSALTLDKRCTKKTVLTDVDSAKSDPKVSDADRNRERRGQFVVGINAVTRCLERDELRAGLVCPSARPVSVTQHLLMLSAIRECPILALPNLSEVMASLLGVRSALAVGFRKLSSQDDKDYFKDLVSFVVLKTPSLSLPWLLDTYPTSTHDSQPNIYLPSNIKTLYNTQST